MFGLFRKKPAQAATPPIEVDLAAIVPVVKAIAFSVASGQAVELSEDDAPIGRSFVADLMILYAEDKPQCFEFISRRRLRELGLSEDELHARALANLPSRPPKIEVHGAPPRQMLVAGGNFEATLLLYDDLWSQLQQHITGEILAVAPARDLVMISDSSWEGAREFLNGIAQKDLEDKSHVLSKCLLKRSEGKWVADGLAS